MPADMVRLPDGRMVPDNRDRGLLMLAWSKGRQVAVVSRGQMAGMTVAEVAHEVGVSVDFARDALMDGEIPSGAGRAGRKITDETIARRRAAGIPERLVTLTLPEIARELGISQNQLNSAIYRGGPKVRT